MHPRHYFSLAGESGDEDDNRDAELAEAERLP
jgi:hypothetical protein